MKHIKTLNTKSLQNTMKKGGCGECQTSCQSSCKTSLYSRKSGAAKTQNKKSAGSMMLEYTGKAFKKPLLLLFCYIVYQELIRWINCDYIVY